MTTPTVRTVLRASAAALSFALLAGTATAQSYDRNDDFDGRSQWRQERRMDDDNTGAMQRRYLDRDINGGSSEAGTGGGEGGESGSGAVTEEHPPRGRVR
jgi:hypothetical protein